MTLFERLYAVYHPDEDVRRRGRLLISIALTLFVMTLLFLPMSLTGANRQIGLSILGICATAALVTLVLGRFGRPSAGGLLIISVVTLALLGAVLLGGSSASVLFFLVLVVVLAQLVLRSWQIWIVLLILFFGLGLANELLPETLPAFRNERDLIIHGGGLLLGMITMLSFLGSRETEQALASTHKAQIELEQRNAALDQLNSELEQRVAERTARLEQLLCERDTQATELRVALEERQQLAMALAETTLPIIPVRDDVLVVPLVGALDSTRAEHLRERLLHEIERCHARTVIIDVTGVPIVDTHVAAALLQTARSVRLLGTRAMLVGIRPEVAQTIVGLGVDLSLLATEATLQQGLERLK